MNLRKKKEKIPKPIKEGKNQDMNGKEVEVSKKKKSNGAKKKKRRKDSTGKMWGKEIALALINLTFIAGLFYILGQLPSRATQLKALRTQSLVVPVSDVDIQKFELKQNIEDIKTISDFFPNDQGLIDFVNEIEKIKSDGSVVGFSFVSKDAVIDKTQNAGLPLVINFVGTWEEIDRDLKRVQELPYMFRPITVTANEIRQDGVVDFNYGGFLYVDKSLEKN